ncbi:VWA domain-containing protein [Streptosporangium longisporum]|uniref:VWA domain-containing protein n=1 Tax=Streptosporangium longisporum TaxID=46187 RepID=A0ABP6KZ04_9ACTN
MIKKKPLAKLKDLATRAGRWLGLAAEAKPVQHTLTVDADRFDQVTWGDTYRQAEALQNLAFDLGEKFDHAPDLLQDAWTAAYKVAPRVRDLSEVDPSRAVNHEVVSSLLGSPEFGELRRNTAGDPYAAAMAVLAQGTALRDMLEKGKQAQQAAQKAADAKTDAEQAAAAVQAALEAAVAAADSDGQVPSDAEQQLQAAIAAAEAAEQEAEQAGKDAETALAQATPGIRTAARQAAHQAAQQAQQEAETMAAWGVGPGELQRMSFAARAALAKRLTGNRLARFTKLIGRFRAMAASERARRVQHTNGEIVGLTLGADLGRLVPSELAMLALPALRADFVSRYAEGRLMMYDSQGEDHVGQGAIIALIDCSMSMREAGPDGITREAWAKACALALLDQARIGGRDFAAILFASKEQQHVLYFPRGQAGIEQVLELAEHFWGGGTDFEAPLGLATDLLEAQFNADGTQRGDMVLITDGECGVSTEWLQGWRSRKENLGFRLFGVSIAHRPGKTLESLCDNLRHVTDLDDLADSRDLFRAI